MSRNERKDLIVRISMLVLFISTVMVCSIDAPAADPQSRTHRDIHYKKEYNFTSDWFTQHIPIWSEVMAEFEGAADIDYLEVGVFEGRAMIWMLENILTHPSARATAIDIFPDDLRLRFMRNIRKSGFIDKVTIIAGGSQTLLKDMSPGSFDIIYIDGDHSAPAVLTDAVYSWPLLKKGGILIFDDYMYKIRERPPEQRPKISVDAFVKSFSEYIDTLSADKQFIIRKKDKLYWEED